MALRKGPGVQAEHSQVCKPGVGLKLLMQSWATPLWRHLKGVSAGGAHFLHSCRLPRGRCG